MITPNSALATAAGWIVAAAALVSCGSPEAVPTPGATRAPKVEAIRIEGKWFGVSGPALPEPDRTVYYQLPDDSTVPESLARTGLRLPAEHPLSAEAFPVIVETELGETGQIERARLLKAPIGLAGSEELLASVLREWRFAPATIAGRPVAVRYLLVINHLPDPNIEGGAAAKPGRSFDRPSASC